jgi:hypothetical protein
MKDYTPTKVFSTAPYPLFENDNSASEANFDLIDKNMYNKLYYLKDALETREGMYSALLSKLGLTVTGINDTDPPTYSSPKILSGQITHHHALEMLDDQIGSNLAFINKVNTNVGGDVATAASMVYANHFFISNGDPHHACIEKLDFALNTLNTSVGAQQVVLNALTTEFDYTKTNVGTGIETAAGLIFADPYWISSGQVIKAIIEKYDHMIDGNRREAYRLKRKEFIRWLASVTATEGAPVYLFSQAEDGYVAGHSSVAPSELRIAAKGVTGQVTYFAKTLLASANRGVFYAEGDSGFVAGNATLKFNLIGSYSDGDMTTITAANIANGDLVLAASGEGTQLVIKIEFSGNAEIYEVFAGLSHS